MENVFKKKVSASFSFHWEYYHNGSIPNIIGNTTINHAPYLLKSTICWILLSSKDLQDVGYNRIGTC